MKIEKQQLLLEYLAENPNLWNRCQHIVKAEYWDIDLRPALEFITEYHQEYKALPDAVKIKAETGIELASQDFSGDTLDYASAEIETFCKHQAAISVIKKAPAMIADDKLEPILKMMKDVIMISLERHIGLDYFDDVEARLRAMLENDATISTGWPSVDKVMGGGLTRKELLLFLATSGGGKSMTMLCLAKNLLAQNLNGMYITLELSEEVVAQRMDMMMSGVNFSKILASIDYVAPAVTMQKHKMGELYIKQFPASTTNALHISATVKEFELEKGYTPDFIIIDYLDLLAPIAKVGRDNLFISEKYIAEEIRNLGFEFDAMIISACQMNRSAINAENHDHAMISGGLSKINTAGWVISLMQNDVMRSACEMLFQFLKTRSSAGQYTKIYMDKDPTSQLVTDSTRKDPTNTKNSQPTDMDDINNKIIDDLVKNTANVTNKLKGLFSGDD